jgi:hypothetical protein
MAAPPTHTLASTLVLAVRFAAVSGGRIKNRQLDYVQESPGVHQGLDDGRSHNPTRWVRERCVADLESGGDAQQEWNFFPSRAAVAPPGWRWDEDTQRSTGCRGWNRSARVLPAKGCH